MKAINPTPLPIKNILLQYEFVIPEFQRPYSWDKEKCVQLWEDLESFLGGNDNEYFLGSIVVYPTSGEGNKIMSVIDGQQRLTTLLLLLKVMLSRAGTMDVLSQMIYKLNPITNLPPKDGKEPCLKSEVQPGDGRDDCADLRKVIAGDLADMDKKNPFKVNYQCLEEVSKEWSESAHEQLHDNLLRFLDKVTMLFIRCDSEEDALTLFQTINDRGTPLNDADIFKAKIYREVSAAGARDDFIARWKKMRKHEDLFRIFMHISRARQSDTSKEIGLRKYMEDNYLGPDCELTGTWEFIMNSLERCHRIGAANDSTVADNEISNKEWAYWVILSQYPNLYWRYPLYVYLHKWTEWDNGKLSLPPEKDGEYAILMKNTIRYFFIKGLAHNAVNTVKDTTYKVCAAIAATEQGCDYVGLYEKNIADKNDHDMFKRKLNDPQLGKYRDGLVLLNAYLNPEQCASDYAKMLGGGVYNIEHILPKKWDHYDGWTKNWTKTSVKSHIDSLGNLAPFEKILNIRAANESFPRKKEQYRQSKVQDILDLLDSTHWRRKEVKERQKESVARLLKFFKEFERV